MSAIETYRKQYLDFVYNFMQFSYNSIWTVSCSAHVYAVYETLYNANEQRVPESTGLTIKDAIERFVFKGERIAQIDSVAWPNNKACSQ